MRLSAVARPSRSFGSLGSRGPSVGSGVTRSSPSSNSVPRGRGVRVAVGTRVGRVSAGSGSEPLGRVLVGRGVLVGGGISGGVGVSLGPGVLVWNGWTVTSSAARLVVAVGEGVCGGARVGSEPPSVIATTALAGTGEAVGGAASGGGAQAVLSDRSDAASQPARRRAGPVLYSGRLSVR